MSHVLLYSRNADENTAEQTALTLSEQLQQAGQHVDICHSLNIPRLILNSYQCVHMIIETLPLTANEAFHLGVCKALGKATVISILNSEKNLAKGFLNFVKPDALSVSQTNHMKYYRQITSNKFVLPALPSTETPAKKSSFKHEAFFIPLQEKMDEALNFKVQGTIYFDGRKLLGKHTSLQLRKKWHDLIAAKKLSEDSHLILSDNKLKELTGEHGLSVVLADPSLTHTEFTEWLSLCFNKKNLIILNEYQATGFSNYWTSGRNCVVLSAHNWAQALTHIDTGADYVSSTCKAGELFEPGINELSRLYSKLWQQKTSLLTSRSVKL